MPKASLLGLVRSVLRVKGLALIEDDHPGWLRVVQAQALPSHVREIRREPTTQPTATRVITQIIPVRHAELNKVIGVIKPFLTTPGGSAVAVEGSRLLIVTDYEATVGRVLELIGLMDTPVPQPAVEIVPVRHQDAAVLAARVSKITADRASFGESRGSSARAVIVTPDDASQTITLVGLPEQIAEAKGYIDQFDVALSTTATNRRRYTPKYVTASRVQALIGPVLGVATGKASATLSVHVDAESNTLYVPPPKPGTPRSGRSSTSLTLRHPRWRSPCGSTSCRTAGRPRCSRRWAVCWATVR